MCSAVKRILYLCCLVVGVALPLSSSFAEEAVYVNNFTRLNYNFNYISYDCKKVADAAQSHGIYFDPTQGYVCTPKDLTCKIDDPNACGGIPADLCGGFSICVGNTSLDTAAAAPSADGKCVQVSATDCSAAADKPGFQDYKECNNFKCQTSILTYSPSGKASYSAKSPWCTTTPKDEGTACSDADPCTSSACGKAKTVTQVSDQVKIEPGFTYSECESKPDPKACDEEFECKIGKCDPAKADGGSPCTYESAPDGTPCDGDNQCKKFECSAGSCVEKGAVTVGSCQICDPNKGIFDKPDCCSADAQCDDGNPCTADKCEANTCKNDPVANGTLINELADCQQVVCKNGKQNTEVKPEPGAPPACNKWECKKNVSTNKWEYVPHPMSDGPNVSCPSDQYCAPKECKAGACQAVPNDCVDKNANDCIETTCDETYDACVGLNKPNCCTADTDCNLPDNVDKACVSATCDPSTKTCKVEFKDPGASCPTDDPANKCVTGACDGSGHCEEKVIVAAPDTNPCTKDYCDPVTGNTVHPVDLGGSCDDGNPCTVDDHCNAAGTCVAGAPYSCAPPDDACLDSAVCEVKDGGAHCEYKPKSSCCKKDLDCGPSTDCQTVSCVIDGGNPTGYCKYENLSGVACALGDDCGECSFGSCKPKAAPADETCKTYECQKGKYIAVPDGVGEACKGPDACKEYACSANGSCEPTAGVNAICNPPKDACPGGNCNPPTDGGTPSGGNQPSDVKTGVQPPTGTTVTPTNSFLQGSGKLGCSLSGSVNVQDALWMSLWILPLLGLRRRR